MLRRAADRQQSSLPGSVGLRSRVMSTQRSYSHFQDPAYLRGEQYKDSRNLNARAQLHRRYSTNDLGWHQWLLSLLPIDGRSKILDCGCGPGNLWAENVTAVPVDCQVTLVDLSDGMVREARKKLGQHETFIGFQSADVAALPYPDHTFDLLIANHMLYHVPDRRGALREMHRVLKRGGRFFAATNGAGHLGELRKLGYEIMPDQTAEIAWMGGAFSLENGASQLLEQFSDVEMYRYQNHLLVTDADDIVAYLLSSPDAASASSPEKVDVLRQTLKQQIDADGAFTIKSDSGVFLARKEG